MSKTTKKESAILQPIIVDKTKYYRQAVVFPDYKNNESSSSLSGKMIYQVDLLLPEWTDKINDEMPWTGVVAPPDESLLSDLGEKISSLQDYYGDAFPKTAAAITPSEKKDKKDKKTEISPRADIFLNKPIDEQGNRLPQVKQTSDIGADTISRVVSNPNILESFDLSKQYFSDESQSNIYLCLAFKLVSVFASSTNIAKGNVQINENVTDTQTSALWQLIYPQNKLAEPVYNPTGFYFVKLFVSGKWRAIKVSHQIPLTMDDKPAVPMSRLELELWPLILSKAIYIAFNVSGISSNDIEVTNSFTQCLDFTRFAVYAMTGWQATQVSTFGDIMNRFHQELLTNEDSILIKSALTNDDMEIVTGDTITSGGMDIDPKLLQQWFSKVVQGGAVSLDYTNTPSLEAPTVSLLASPEGIANLNQTTLLQLTKNQFDRYHAIKNGQIIEMSEKINNRNNRILEIEKALHQSFSEIFVVHLPEPVVESTTTEVIAAHQTELLSLETKGATENGEEINKEGLDITVSAITLEETADLAKAVAESAASSYESNCYPVLGVRINLSNLLDSQLLLSWSTTHDPSYNQVTGLGDAVDTTVALVGKQFTPHLPQLPSNIPLKQVYVSLREILKRNGQFFSFQTRQTHIHQSMIPYRWVCSLTSTDTAASAAAVTSKAVSSDASKDKTIKKSSIIAATTLSADSFTVKSVSDLGLCSHPGMFPPSLVVISLDAPATSYIDENQSDNVPTSVVESVSAEFVTVSVFVQADAAVLSTAGDPKYGIHKDDNVTSLNTTDEVTVVLEELNLSSTDSESVKHKPLVLTRVIKLNTLNFMMDRIDFRIPVASLAPLSSEGLTNATPGLSTVLFSVKCDSELSLTLSISCNMSIEANSLEKFFGTAGAMNLTERGVCMVSYDGTSQPLYGNSEQILFRYNAPLPQVSRSVYPFAYCADKNIVRNIKLASFTSSQSSSLLPVVNTAINVSGGGVLLSPKSATQTTSQSSMNTNTDEFVTIMGYITSADTASNSINLHTEKDLSNLTLILKQSAFTWKVFFLSTNAAPQITPLYNTLPLYPASDVLPYYNTKSSVRFFGDYRANIKFMLFSDVLTVEKSSFPIALKMVLEKTQLPESEDFEELKVCCRVYMKSTNDSNGIDTTSASAAANKEKLSGSEGLPLLKEIHGINGFQDYLIFAQDGLTELASSASAASLAESPVLSAAGSTIDLKNSQSIGSTAAGNINNKDKKPVVASATDAKSKSKGAAQTTPTVELLLECTLDFSDGDFAAQKFRSRYPYQFYDAFTSKPTDEVQQNQGSSERPSDNLITWRLDVLTGKVLSLGHDVFDIQRFNQLKLSWQTSASTGVSDATRALKASKAMQIYQMKKQKSGNMSDDTTAAVTSLLAEILTPQPVVVGLPSAVNETLAAALISAKPHLTEVDPATIEEGVAMTPLNLNEKFYKQNAVYLDFSNRGDNSDDTSYRSIQALNDFNNSIKQNTHLILQNAQDDNKLAKQKFVEIWKRRDAYRLQLVESMTPPASGKK